MRSRSPEVRRALYVGGQTTWPITATHTLTLPSNTQPGDLGVIITGYGSGWTLTLPSGWVRPGSDVTGANSGQQVRLTVLVRVIQPGDTTAVLDFGSTSNAASSLAVFRGVTGVAAFANSANSSTSQTWTAPEIGLLPGQTALHGFAWMRTPPGDGATANGDGGLIVGGVAPSTDADTWTRVQASIVNSKSSSAPTLTLALSSASIAAASMVLI